MQVSFTKSLLDLLDIEDSLKIIEESTDKNDALERFKELRDRINVEIEELVQNSYWTFGEISSKSITMTDYEVGDQ